MLRAGLGRKQLTLLEHGDSSEFHAEIMTSFPDLKEGGGYELLCLGECNSTARNALQIITPPTGGYTVTYLKEVVRQAKVYIRPVQRNLSLEAKPLLSSDTVCSCV